MALKLILNIRLIKTVILIVNYWNICDAGLRVLGGRNALKDEFPYVVSLEYKLMRRVGETHFFWDFYQFCTGAALTPTWILTAAHCDDNSMDYHELTDMKMFARYNSYFPSELGQVSPITNVFDYPGFTSSFINSSIRIKNDIALYQTENLSVSQYGKISAIDYISFVGHEVFVLGFGNTNATPTEKPLQVLKGMLIKCDPREGKLYGMLCVVPRCGIDATICGGDSGGPVVHASGVVGVNTMAFGDCNEFQYVIRPGHVAAGITMVSPVVDWISSIIANKSIGRS